MAEITPVPLAALTTLGTGGTPARMIDANTTDELITALREEWSYGGRCLVLGGGSNLFVGDGPLDLTVIRVLTHGIERLPDPQSGVARVRVAAGHGWDDLVAYTVGEGLAGIEALSGIPGTVGAAPVQNIGAYGQEIVQTLVSVQLIDESTMEVLEVPAAELKLGFRTSVLKAHDGGVPIREAVILTVTLDLAIVGDAGIAIGGAQLRNALGLADGDTAALADIRTRILQVRAGKGMVLDPADPDTNSAGSFFQNAVVSETVARTLPEDCPRWPVAPDSGTATVIPLTAFDGSVPSLDAQVPDVKVSAAWLIEHAGFAKGFHLPGSRASLSTKHTLALTNRGGARAEEIAELARFVRTRVLQEYGLMLRPEPVLVSVEI
ncbi:UDP-N-acetylmuramate dehydrogenase [Microbacterium gorillae]|uniref:UDP-N-acetylmuramate dehydrogenase n=1 Tax=Microbacterium gorillae TaxID=1231063 RepID=UPI000590FBCC|nr:UDP-N-acetylmuramate dehydrogenase [Microbacterium gorillae]